MYDTCKRLRTVVVGIATWLVMWRKVFFCNPWLYASLAYIPWRDWCSQSLKVSFECQWCVPLQTIMVFFWITCISAVPNNTLDSFAKTVWMRVVLCLDCRCSIWVRNGPTEHCSPHFWGMIILRATRKTQAFMIEQVKNQTVAGFNQGWGDLFCAVSASQELNQSFYWSSCGAVYPQGHTLINTRYHTANTGEAVCDVASKKTWFVIWLYV